MDDYAANFAKNLKVLRTRRGIAQNSLAELCGLGLNSIYQFERGTRKPKLSEVCALADYFEIRIDDFIGRSI